MKLFFFLILCIPLVVSIGVSPPLHKMTLEPGKVQELTHNVVNGDDQPITISVNLSDTLAPYIELRETEAVVPPLGRYAIKYTLTHPEDLRPGWNKGKIHIIDTTERGGGMFSIAVGVVAEVRIFSPYPDKYAEISFGVESVNEGQDIDYNLVIRSLGFEDITGSSADMAFHYNDGTIVKRLNEDNIDVKSMGKTSVNGTLPAKDFKKGLYFARAVYHYGKDVELETNFQVGSYEVDIINHSNELFAGSITPVPVSLKNMWNGDIKQVYCTITIDGKEYRSLDVYMRPFAEQTFTVYVDDMSFVLGDTVDATITAHFDGEEKSKKIIMTVVDKEFAASTETPSILTTIFASHTVYLVIAVMLLIIINLILLRRKK